VTDGPAVPPALELVGVSSGYGDTTVLREVSLTVPRGRVVALLGANGAGKTTLLRTASGLIRPTAGQVRLDGVDVTGARAYQRSARGLCHIPEGRGVFRSLTVRENLTLQARRGQEVAAIERASAAFPILGDRLKQVAGTLSGGQQQMLAMAAAYVRRPRLVLVDEASLGLAPRIVDEIFEFLSTLASIGVSLLVVDQFVVRALEIATHAYVLHRGSLVYAGEPQTLLDGSAFERYIGS
jgi:branched-chain amino acid transport system ATP-binding protein